MVARVRTAHVCVALGVLALPACGDEAEQGRNTRWEDDETALRVLTDEECGALLEIDTVGSRLEDVEGPSAADAAVDAANPSGAELSGYRAIVAVEQSFRNLLDLPMQIEEASATLEPTGSGERYDTDYSLDAPLELEPGIAERIELLLRVPADQVSPGYMLGLLEGAATLDIAPLVRVTVPGTDNCGYPEGMIVRGRSGTVEVERPVELGVLGELFKGILHNL